MKELIEIQNKLLAPKSRYNKFGGFYYRSCEDILDAVKPLLKELGCTLNISDEIEFKGARYYVKATARLTNDKGQTEQSTAYAREEETKKGMDGSQLTGVASSYARKYALNGLFCIDDTKDADTDENRNESERRAERPQRAETSYQASATPPSATSAERPARKEITAAMLDDSRLDANGKTFLDRLLAFAYSGRTTSKNPEEFDAGDYLAHVYAVSGEVQERFRALFRSYVQAKSGR